MSQRRTHIAVAVGTARPARDKLKNMTISIHRYLLPQCFGISLWCFDLYHRCLTILVIIVCIHQGEHLCLPCLLFLFL